MVFLVFAHLLSVVFSYYLIRETTKKLVENPNVELEEFAVLVLMIMPLIPVINLAFAFRTFNKANLSAHTLVETFFFIKSK